LGSGLDADTFALGGFSALGLACALGAALGLACALGGGARQEDLSAEKLGKPFGMTGTTGIEPCLITGAEAGLGAPADVPGLGAPADVVAVPGAGALANFGAASGLGASVAASGAAPSTLPEPDSAAPEFCSLFSTVSIFASPPLVLDCCSCLLISPAAAVASS